MRIELGRYRLQGPMVLLLLMVAVLPVLIKLGLWQWDRAKEKESMVASFEQAQAKPAARVDVDALSTLDTYSKVLLSGQFDPSKQLLLDNQIYQHQAGFNVLTPVQIDGKLLLVNRGWVAAKGRAPTEAIGIDEVDFEAVEFFITRPSVGILLGDPLADQSGSAWPRIVQAPDIEKIQSLYDKPLLPEVLHSVQSQRWDFKQNWKAVGGSPAKHYNYAMQWWGFAIALVAMTLWVTIKAKDHDSSQ